MTLENRSLPRCPVVPVLAVRDVAAATRWLCDAFGFSLRIGIGAHRAQLNAGDGAVVITRADRAPANILVRIEGADAHHARAVAHGATIIQPPTDHPYGERQYVCTDLDGHRWTFSQTIADVDPAVWGGVIGELER